MRVITWDGCVLTVQTDGSLTDGQKIRWDSLEKLAEREAYTVLPRQPFFSPWRHGGWYVSNLVYPSGACGCVSRNYPDKKWRIVCDERRRELEADGDFTFPTREAAAEAEFALAADQWAKTMK